MVERLLSDIQPGQRYLSAKQLVIYTGLGRSKALKVGQEAGAEIRLGGRTLYDIKALDAYFDSKRS